MDLYQGTGPSGANIRVLNFLTANHHQRELDEH
jgi:hypothetical protein